MFTLPWEHWLRQELRLEMERGLLGPPDCLAGMVNRQAVAETWRQFLAGRTSWSRPWSLYVLFRWLSDHCDAGSSRTPL